MPQATLDRFFPPVSPPRETPSETAEYLWEPGRQTLTCNVYLYTCARTGDPVYVGQTIQEPKARDRQHRNYWQTVFDRSYIEDGQYVFTVLEQRVFEDQVTDEADDRALHAEAQAWLDARETHNINEYQTYDPTGAGPGLNQTRGGQPAALAAYVQAARRESHRRWRELYAPGFETWMEANQTSLLHVKLTDTVPAPEVAGGTLKLGTLVSNIRSDRTAVPAEWRAWLDERGFAWDYPAAMWERVYIPGFEAWQEANQTSLLHVKRADTVSAPEASNGILKLGKLVNSIRTGYKTVPTAWRAWLEERGFAWDYQAAMWERVYIPGFEAWMKANQTSLLHVRRADAVPVPDAPNGVLPIGNLVHGIRTGDTSVPAEWHAWLEERGFAWDYQAAMWERVYIPGFEAWQQANHKSLLNIKLQVTIPAPEAVDGVLKLGQLVDCIRCGHTTVPDQWRAWLEERGFAWDYQAAMWERVYIPGFQVWQEANQTSLLHVKYADRVPVAEAPDGVLKLGNLVVNIRSGVTSVPAEWRAWLDERGFAWDYQAAMWERVYIPGFEAWMKANHTSLLHVKCADTVPAPESSNGILPIGRLVVSIRTGNTAVPAEWRAWLDERGFLWHTRNLATHVQRRLQRLKEQLPTTAPALAQDAEVTLALSVLYGTGAFGLASESLVELEARYLGDLARL